MKTSRLVSALAAAALLLSPCFSSCASVTPYKESVLVEAGFQPVMPQTVSERNAYAALPAYEVERTNAPGHPVYAYRNESKDVTYIGGDAEYQRYQQLLQKKGADRADRLAMQMNQDSLHMFR